MPLEVFDMLQHQYLQKVRELIDKIEIAQDMQIDVAAEAIAVALASGHGFFISSLGHGNDGDLLNRAGGLMAAQRFNFNWQVNSPIADALQDRPRPEPFDAELEAARVAVRSSQLRSGDCLITGSVSGRSSRPISTAIGAREIGVTVIAIMSLQYTQQVQSLHTSGKRLFEVVDIVIDNCVPYGDACLEVEGLPAPVFPLSGIANTIVCWMICAQVIEKMLAQGLQPHVYMSVNREGGSEFNEKQQAEYNRVGY